MQSASSNFTAEMSGGNVVWAPPRVFADWARDGYGADGSIDDLSAQVGSDFVVSHHLDDGLPEQVTFVSGVGSPTLATPLVYGRGNRASTYFSPYNASSPVSGFDRDVAPVKLDWGAVTAAGMEYVRLFTGQMGNIRIKGQAAELEAMSATRAKLRKLIQLPAVWGAKAGLNATWPVSYALSQSGVNVSPPPRSGCRWHAPMHGSMTPFIGHPSYSGDAANYGADQWDPGQSASYSIRPTFVPGPFLSGMFGQATATKRVNNSMTFMVPAPGADFISRAGNKGRVEFWVRGDAANFNATPGGSANITNPVAIYFYNQDRLNQGFVECGVNKDRKAFLNVNSGEGTTWGSVSPDVLPSDGGWYFFGAAWDISGAKMWLTRWTSTTVDIGIPTTTTAKLPPVDILDIAYPLFNALLPVAELHVTTGANASPDVSPWINSPSYVWTSGATIRPSFLELEALTETAPREAWELIGSYAQAELATMRADEVDKFNYLPMSYWAESAQQVTVDALSTSTNMADIDINADPSKIYNRVSVSYTDTRMDTIAGPLYAAKTGLPSIPPGVTTFRVAFNKPAADINHGFDRLNDAGLTPLPNPWTPYVTLNTAPDGLGTYIVDSSAFVQVTAWTPAGADLTCTNKTGVTLYFANQHTNVAAIQLVGTAPTIATASAVATDAASVANRGERSLTVSLPAIQRQADALAVAAELAARLMKPRPVIGEVTLFPDPRRQPGDLVTLTDAVNTGASGLWRVQSIEHNRSGDSYTQKATLRKAMTVGVWDQSSWDDCIWGP